MKSMRVKVAVKAPVENPLWDCLLLAPAAVVFLLWTLGGF